MKKFLALLLALCMVLALWDVLSPQRPGSLLFEAAPNQ